MYEGEWFADRRHGKGTMCYASGNAYEGAWVDDVKHGRGTMRWAGRRQRHTGEWREGKPNGKGVMVWYLVPPEDREGIVIRQEGRSVARVCAFVCSVSHFDWG